MASTVAISNRASERLSFNLRRARVLMMTGHREGAVQVFNDVAGGLQELDRARGGGVLFTVPARALVRRRGRTLAPWRSSGPPGVFWC